MNSQLQLERSFFDNLRVEAVPEFKAGDDPISISGSIAVEVDTDTGDSETTQIVLTVEVEPEPEAPAPPYTACVRAIGVFRWNDDESPLDAQERERIIAVNGASILYSSLREYLLLITSRGPWGPFSLPTVDFRAMDYSVRPSTRGDDEGESAAQTRDSQSPKKRSGPSPSTKRKRSQARSGKHKE